MVASCIDNHMLILAFAAFGIRSIFCFQRFFTFSNNQNRYFIIHIMALKIGIRFNNQKKL